MLHLENDAFSTVLAFHASSELLNHCLCLILAFPNELQLSFEWPCERQTDNDAISNFGPSNLALQRLTLQPCLFAALSLFVFDLSWLFGPYCFGSLGPFCSFWSLWSCGPLALSPLALWLLACAPLASAPLVLAPLWP